MAQERIEVNVDASQPIPYPVVGVEAMQAGRSGNFVHCRLMNGCDHSWVTCLEIDQPETFIWIIVDAIQRDTGAMLDQQI